MKNMKNRFSDPDPDSDPLLPNMDPRIPIHFSQMWIRILIHVKMRWIRNAELKANLHLHPMLEADTQFVTILSNCHIELTAIQTLTYARTDKVISKDCFNSKNYAS